MTVSRGEVGQEGAAPVSDSSAWGPFRSRDFTRMASAQFVSNVGGWMQAPEDRSQAIALGAVNQNLSPAVPKPGREHEVIEKLYAGRYARRRTGAMRWSVWTDVADPGRVCEPFVVGSWEEHLRQHERVSRRDEQRLQEIADLTDPVQPPKVAHWLAAHQPDERS